MKKINEELLNKVSQEAKESPRLRMNYNFHEHLDDKAQRLLNALEPGTLLPIHRHRHTAETYILLRGKITVLFYNELRELQEEEIRSSEEGNYGVHIPVEEWHTLEVLETGSVIFEVKEGPYTPLTPADILSEQEHE